MADHPVPASAVELTDDEIAQRAEEMFSLDQQVRAGLKTGRGGLGEAARALHQFDEQSGWSALGFESVRHYCADPGIEISRSTYQRMVRAYDRTVVRRQVDFDRVKQIDRSKVDIVLTKVDTGEKSMDEALDDAEALGLRDLRDLYWGEQKPDPDSGVTADPEEDDTGTVYGLDEEVDAEPVEEVAGEEEEAETAPQMIYGEVQFQQVREARDACRQGLDTPSELLKRVALEKAIAAFDVILDAAA
jgi:hypothetical protein